MPNVQISDLPAALPLDGSELVPIVQSGVTVRTTTAQVAGSPSQQQTFLTKNQEPSLPNSRYLSTGTGLGLTDNGALSYYQLTLNGASGSLEAAGNGLVAKTGASTVTSRFIAVSGSGLSVTNGSGVSGDPTLALSGLPASLAGLSGTGILNMISSTSVGTIEILGTANQISVANGNGVGNPTISITSNPILPGVEGVVFPRGTTAERPLVPTNGELRYNTDTNNFEGYANGVWGSVSTGGGVTSINASGGTTGLTFTGGPITSSGTLTLGGTLDVPSGGTGVTSLTGYVKGNGTSAMTATATIPVSDLSGTLPVPNGGTGATTLTGYVKGNGMSAMTASATVPTSDLSGNISNAQLDNSSITINGNAVSLGGSTTVTASTTSTLTIGTGLSGTSFDGGSPVTIAIDSTVATLTGTQTLTNKSISGSTNTLTNIPNNALTNSSVTIGTTAISLGGTSTTLAGLTSVTLTQDPVSALEAATKQYVDALASGLNFHQACNYATTAPLGTYVYNNGASGVGATITQSLPYSALVIDGHTFVSPADINKRVLIKNEPSAGGFNAYNGIYTVTAVGSGVAPWVLTRATDFDTAGTGLNQIDAGDLMLILSGSTLANTSWVQQTPLPIVVGTTPIEFSQFAAPLVYTAGTGLTESPPFQFNIANTTVTAASYGSASKTLTATVNAQGQLTALADADIAINGNQITSGTVGSAYISGSYTGITGVGTLTAGTWNADAIQPLYGGTGLTSYTAGDLIYASGTSALSKLGLGTQGQVLVAGASAPTWSGISGGTF